MPNEKVFLLPKFMKKVVFNVSELYYIAEQQCRCIKPQFIAVQTQVRCVQFLGSVVLGQLYYLGLGKAEFKEKIVSKWN